MRGYHSRILRQSASLCRFTMALAELSTEREIANASDPYY